MANLNKYMDGAAGLGRNPVSKHQIQPEYMEMGRLTRDGTTEPLSRDQILRRERGQGIINFPCSADREQDWQIYPIDPSCCMCDQTYIHTYIQFLILACLGYIPPLIGLPCRLRFLCGCI